MNFTANGITQSSPEIKHFQNCILCFLTGPKWIGMSLGGVLQFDGKNWTWYYDGNSNLRDNGIQSIAIDGAGNKWIGTSSALTKFDGVNWTDYYQLQVEGGTYVVTKGVNDIIITAQSGIWFGFAGGLLKFDGQKWKLYNNIPTSVSVTAVGSTAVDAQGNVWIGLIRDVFPFQWILVKFDGSNWTEYKVNLNIPNDVSTYVNDIAIDPQGNKWIATSRGLVKFDGINWTLYDKSNSGLPDNTVWDVTIDETGNKWIATFNGVAKFDGASWVVLNKSNSGLPDNIVRIIFIDKSGNKWIGTELGLAIYHEGGISGM